MAFFCALTSTHVHTRSHRHTHTQRAPTGCHNVWVISAGGWPKRRLCASEPPRRPPSWEAAHRGNEGEWLTSLFLFFSPQLCLQTALWCGKLKRASVSISPYVQPHSSISSPSPHGPLLSLLFFFSVDPRKQSMTLFTTTTLPPTRCHRALIIWRVFVCLCRPTTKLATLCVYVYECASVRIQGPPLIIF